MRLGRWFWFFCLFGCGEEVTPCFDDRSCGTGFRCIVASAGAKGTCGPCDATEVPYDGIDNDCSPASRDADRDQDGENWDQAPVRPGRDCDDEDPNVGPQARELCTDNIDNDCDDQVDEADCGDINPPTARFLSPAGGRVLSGTISVRVETTDDVGVVRFRLSANGITITEQMAAPQPMRVFETNLDTNNLADGDATLSVEVADLLERTTQASVRVVIDNETPPTLSVSAPAANAVHAGRMTITAIAEDPSGVAEVRFSIDGVEIGTSTNAPYRWVVNTASFSEGRHELEARAVDLGGSASLRRVSFLVDRTAPTLLFEEPQAQAEVRGQIRARLTATDSVSLAEIVSEGFRGPSPLEYDFDTTRLPNGAYRLTAEVRDNAIVDDVPGNGNRSTASVTVQINNVDPSPVVRLTEPLNGWGVFRDTPIRAQVTSPGGFTITSVDFRVGGQVVFSDTAAPYETNYDFRSDTGTVAIVVTALDNQGNRGTASATVSVVPSHNFRAASFQRVPGALGTAGYDVADVDGDGVIDVVTAGSEISLMRGRRLGPGGWSLAPGVRISSQGALDVRLADVDMDLDLDVVALTANSLRIYPNLGMGNFGVVREATIPRGGLVAFDVADLDNDGDPDAVVVGGVVPGSVLRIQNGNFVFSQDLGGDGSVSDVVIAHASGDNFRDVVVGRTGVGNNAVTVYLNGGLGNFGAGLDTLASGPAESVVVGDVTRDGYPDIVALIPSLDAFEYLIGTAANPGTFVPGPAFLVQDEPRGIALGDLNNDNELDIVVAATRANGVEVMLNSGALSLSYVGAYTTLLNSRRPRIIDLNGDGRRDVTFSSGGDTNLGWAFNRGQGVLSAAPVLLLDEAPRALAVGQVLGSTLADVVIGFDRRTVGTQTIPPRVRVVVSEGGGDLSLVNGALELPLTMSPPTSISVGDLLNDGFVDIAVGSAVLPAMPTDATLAVFFGSDQGFGLDTLSEARPQAVMLADVDADGVDELLFTRNPNGAGDGSVVFQLDPVGASLFIASGDGPVGLTTGNLDSDALNRNDFAVANAGSDNITVNLWNGVNYTSALYNVPQGVSALTVGLVGTDSFTDLVGVSQAGVFVLEGNPAFGFSTPVVWPAGAQPFRVAGGDFNGDGLYDVLVLNSGDRASLLLARPQGGFFPPVPLDLGEQPIDFVVADFDGDGLVDLAFAQTGVHGLTFVFNELP